MPTPVALVTGAGRGIGRTVAIALAERGYAVALTARSQAELEETAAACAGPTLVLPGDITDASFVDELVTATEDQLGPVDVLVANAGAGFAAPLARTSDEDWQRQLDLNLTAPFRLLRRVVPTMVKRGYGRVVVVASIAAKVGEPYITAYTASKHGVLGLVRSAAAEVAGKGVTINAVCPGYVDTPMTARTIADIAARTGRSPEEAAAILAAKQPGGRLVTTDEVAAAILHCVDSDDLNGEGVDVVGS